MLTRTWPYGTTLAATVLSVKPGVIVLQDENGEGHVLFGQCSDGLSEGTAGKIVFEKGRQRTGGYWRFVREEPR